MTLLKRVEIGGTCEAGRFSGEFRFEDGLNVITTNNAYGKSLVARSIAWCFGLEPMFGLSANDNSRFPPAVKHHIELEGNEWAVSYSFAQIELFRSAKDGLRLKRAIHGGDLSKVECDLISEVAAIPTRSFTLVAHQNTFKDESGGLQNFLFEWLGIRKYELLTSRHKISPLYLENLAPHFLIDQEQGWANIQSLQVYKYGILEVAAASIEAILGAEQALESRRIEQTETSRKFEVKVLADNLVARVKDLFLEAGWPPIFERKPVLERAIQEWTMIDLVGLVREKFNFDPGREIEALEARVSRARERLTIGDAESEGTTPVRQTSQRVVELKAQRHTLLEQLRDLRRQHEEQTSVADTLDQRLRSSKDLIRLKEEGIGRMESVDCPACARPIGLADFGLTSQDKESIEEHIRALRAEQVLFRRNIEATGFAIEQTRSKHAQIEEQLEDANRALSLVTQTAGSSRESLVKAATDFAEAERDLRKTRALFKRLIELQDELRAWARTTLIGTPPKLDVEDELRPRLSVLSKKLGSYLIAFGHSAFDDRTSEMVTVESDDNYEPYITSIDRKLHRKVRSLGSASDHPRLVAAYALALAETALVPDFHGNHPGFVVLDEPLQQNPDAKHRAGFVDALERLRGRPSCQVVIFTHLTSDEVARLKEARVPIYEPSGKHLLVLEKDARRTT